MSKADMPPTMRGYVPFEVVSALQKAVRRSDTDAALYWSAELFKSGYSAWAWKRLRVIMTEDVGPAMAPGTVADIWALKMFAEEGTKKDPKHDKTMEFFYFAHAVVLLCKSPKTRLADNAFMYHLTDRVPRREIPDEAYDVHTQKGRQMGRGWEFFVEESGRLIEPDDRAAEQGYASVDDELEALSEHYLKAWLAGRSSSEPPENPFRRVSESAGKLQAGKGVTTHYVQRPLGIPMPGEPKPENSEGETEDDGDE